MNDQPAKVPHFLRVVRALAKVSGVAVPIAAAITSLGGTSCGSVHGVQYVGVGGQGGVPNGQGGAGGAGGSSGTHLGLTSMTNGSGGSGGAAMGVTVMPDGGTDGGH